MLLHCVVVSRLVFVIEAQEKDTAFVMQSFGDDTAYSAYLIERYVRQLYGKRLSVLRDMSAADGGVRFIRRARYDECQVSWSAAFHVAPKKALEILRDPHIANAVYQVLWWKFCAKRKVRYAWFVEADAYFHGNVSTFVKALAARPEDLVAAGFRIATKSWHLWKPTVQPLWQGQILTATNSSGIVTNLKQINGLGQGPHICTGRPDAFTLENKTTLHSIQGVLFHQAHVVRISSSLLDRMTAALSLGNVIASEVWAPTLCAYFAPTCLSYDFAPIFKDSEHMLDWDSLQDRPWVSPNYCWAKPYNFAAKNRLHCRHSSFPRHRRRRNFNQSIILFDDDGVEDQWENRWIHAVKASRCATAMDCDSPASCMAN